MNHKIELRKLHTGNKTRELKSWVPLLISSKVNGKTICKEQNWGWKKKKNRFVFRNDMLPNVGVRDRERDKS